MNLTQTVFDTGNVDQSSQQMSSSSSSMLTCMQACQQCHDTCRKAAFGISPAAAQELAADDVRLLVECAELCQLSANWQLAGSQYCRQICAVCAQVCRQCQDRCSDDAGLQECATACRRCAESCEAMSEMA
ncbi:uncharacterized protein YggL (DUF469 family) [Herbaspirillum rubrisubalbicans]|uniref:hypothetical protein n=1 Tax=Herbaspirillum rubrisubalbicans TaxID=80842 RepID=UPI00209E79F0|nr:hypothetical protein [Herbaspirillum rubrisubalbicans]MCP1574252.1 uncharacterized protein YggL (DUF469 family) [Herbaspirillum rubrisubalbicans]